MARRLCWALLGATALTAVTVTGGVAADTEEFADFPDVPEHSRIDTAFREVGGYIGVRGGAARADDSDFLLTPATRVETAYDDALTGSAFVGVDVPDLYYGAGVRLEAELSHTVFDVDSHAPTGTLFDGDAAFGETRVTAGFLNAYIDVGFSGGLGTIRPFIGGGVGLARAIFHDHGTAVAMRMLDDAHTGFAWQVMGGVGVNVTSQITLEAMVRHQAVPGIDLTATTGTVSETDLSSTQVLVGARLSF